MTSGILQVLSNQGIQRPLQRQGSARRVSDGELRKLTKKNIGAGSQDGQNANIRSKEKPTPLALLVLIGPLQRQGSARQVSNGELIEFTKILSMLLVSGEKSLRILGPVWVHGSAAKARGSQEQISPGFCALKSDSEQLRAIYTPEKVKGHTATASLGHEFRRLVTRNRADFKATNSQHSAGSSAMGSLARAIDTRGGRTPTQLAQALGQSAVAPECCGSRFEASGSARACS
ncbi:hypothetical protein C8F04DRAFT_1182916 [Mycena alexandri]|uniref:Uncharacterized protein n=1 Tax=Mycena alexandri TaxID=1745969 RepID=A0AAD6T033_9AGAR|nr:hypothetical protein C8F04DRAFT_1182916 [Mycena alexandri]